MLRFKPKDSKMYFLGNIILFYMVFPMRTEPVGNVTTNPSRCISEVASSGPSGCENSHTTQGTECDNTLRKYKMLFFISLAMMAVLITVLVVVIFKLVKQKKGIPTPVPRENTHLTRGHTTDIEVDGHVHYASLDLDQKTRRKNSAVVKQEKTIYASVQLE